MYELPHAIGSSMSEQKMQPVGDAGELKLRHPEDEMPEGYGPLVLNSAGPIIQSLDKTPCPILHMALVSLTLTIAHVIMMAVLKFIEDGSHGHSLYDSCYCDCNILCLY